ncbi:hypothetical protein FACS189461_2690 [Spirochaetia bacterium]|nr:hypothetical protein FACS189461_2690 [Spirochaetia bacterium]
MRKRCFVGFDAFIDYITRPIAGKEGGVKRHFHDLEEYAAFLSQRNDKSFSVELEVPGVKMGGNNPNISGILSRCGVDVVSFGAYGVPVMDPIFLPLAEKCRLVSFANPGKCTAYEFAVSKMMNFYNMDSRDFTWENLLRCISPEEIVSLLMPADMILFVNLGEQPAVLNIMEMFLTHVFPRFTGRKRFFLDFSDCSHMGKDELARSLDFLKNLKPFGDVILSANENEFRILSGRGDTGEYTGAALKTFREALGVDAVLLRTLRTFYFSITESTKITEGEGEVFQVPNDIVENPRFLTGAGDAQNAGFCLGLLAGQPVEKALLAAVRAGNLYIRTGEVDPNFI